jgi:hypothetical protein
VIRGRALVRPNRPKATVEAAASAPTLPLVAPDFDPIIDANQRGLTAAVAANGQALMRMARMNDELFGFLSRRLERDRITAKELQDCKSAQAAVSLCTQFFEMAMRQYSEELGLLTSIYVDQAGEAMADAERQRAMMTPEAPSDDAAPTIPATPEGEAA